MDFWSDFDDVDFVFEDEEYIYLVEYKNASISNAANPASFNPAGGDKIRNVGRKYYDSLHYLFLMKKWKPKKYIYIPEYPNGDSSSGRLVRNKLIRYLPFRLQSDYDRLIESVEVLAVSEWNTHAVYKNYPLIRTEE